MRVRAITIQIIEPLSGTWKDFGIALGEMWALTTQASNWMMREFYARDVRRADQPKMPPMPKIYLYPEVRQLFPALPPQCVASLERTVSRKYRQLRYRILWTSAVSLPTFRYPAPFPINNQSWSCRFDQGNRPVVTIPLPGEQGKHWDLRLMGGTRYSRQIAAFRQMVKGEVRRGQMLLFKNHHGQVLCAMAGYFPSSELRDTQRVLSVRTDTNRLLSAFDESAEPIWNLNFDHVRRWIAEYRSRLERLRQDRKPEQHPHPAFESRQRNAVLKQQRRLDSAVKEAAAELCNFAVRRKFGGIRYNDEEHSFAESFPWFRLRDRIENKCEDLGLAFEHETDKAFKTHRPARAAHEGQRTH